MNNAFLVAWREFTENTKTKGFWIGIFLFPAILLLTIQVPILLENKGTPTRHFVVVDQSEQFDKTVEQALEKHHQRRVLQALNEYATQHAAPRASDGGRATGRRNGLAQFSDVDGEAVEQFRRRGGQEFYLRELQPRLKPGAPKFAEPRRQFQRVPTPPNLQTNADLAVLAQELKP